MKSDLNEALIFSDIFSKNTQIPNFTKILPMEAELFHADGQTYRYDELIVAFLSFANAPENHQLMLCREIKFASSENHTKHTNAQQAESVIYCPRARWCMK
jgi:NAD(P)H-nitrite reductase large subunit